MDLSIGNVLADLLSEEDLAKYQETEYPFNLSILYPVLKAKMEEDPDYEVWVPFIYYKCSVYVKKSTNLVLQPYKIFISNKGAIGSLRDGEFRLLSQPLNKNYYKAFVKCDVKQFEGIQVHRALACAFIPLPEELKLSHPKDLHVNHVDGIKTNIELSNLEWTTPSGNTLHAFANGLMSNPSGSANSRTKPVKGIVLVGPFAGQEFVLRGNKELKANGFDPSGVSYCCAGSQKFHKNCSWSFATEEEIELLPKTVPGKELEDKGYDVNKTRGP